MGSNMIFGESISIAIAPLLHLTSLRQTTDRTKDTYQMANAIDRDQFFLFPVYEQQQGAEVARVPLTDSSIFPSPSLSPLIFFF